MKFNGRAILTKRIVAIPALGLAGLLGVAACGTAAPATTSAADQPPPASTPQTTPASTPQTTPASTPQTTQAAQVGPSPQQVAQWIAGIAVGNGSLTALQWSDGQATYADCDPSTVSNPPGAGTPTSASCDITYSDGSVWDQTVTITVNSQANPVSDSTNVGTELSQPTNGSSGPQPNSPGNNSSYGNYLNANSQAQDEQDGAIDDQGPGVTTNGDNDAGTGGDYDDSGS